MSQKGKLLGEGWGEGSKLRGTSCELFQAGWAPGSCRMCPSPRNVHTPVNMFPRTAGRIKAAGGAEVASQLTLRWESVLIVQGPVESQGP